MRLVLDGYQRISITEGLGIGRETVRTHVKCRYGKTRVGNRAGLLGLVFHAIRSPVAPTETVSIASPRRGPECSDDRSSDNSFAGVKKGTHCGTEWVGVQP